MKKRLKNLVQYSYNSGELDETTVETIANHLSRKELKHYLALLRQEELKKQISVISAKTLTDAEQEKVKAIFPEKSVIFFTDQTMIAGVKVIENDQEFEINLNRTFDDIMTHLSSV